MKSSFVSVIIPVYNSIQFLNQTIASVNKQHYNAIEIIIADNGSDQKETLTGLKKLEQEFTVLYTGKTGVSNARNKAIEQAAGEFILPLDSDDLIEPSFIEKCVEQFKKNPKTTVVRTHIELIGEKKGIITFGEYSFNKLLARNLMVVTSMFRKKDWEKVGGFDTDFVDSFEDWDFWIKLLRDGGEVHTINEYLFKYRIQKNSRNHSLSNDKLKKLRKLIWQKHKAEYGKHFVDPLESFEYQMLKDSFAYKLGNKLSWPFSFLKLMR